MKTVTWGVPLALVLATGVVAPAQDAPRPASAADRDEVAMTDEDDAVADEADEARPRRKIKVLEHPYQIASFYRQRESALFAPVPEGGAGPYGLAGFYRLGQGERPYGYSRFWSTGYGSHARDSRGLVIGYRRSIGENGDLFLFAPVFLGPLGPLSR